MSKKSEGVEFDSLLTADKHEAGAEMEIIHPATGEKTGVFLLIKGVDSKTFRKASAEFNKARLTAKPEQLDDLALEMTVAITEGWRGLKDKEFSKDAVRKLYTDSPAIRSQVDNWFQQRRNFTKG